MNGFEGRIIVEPDEKMFHAFCPDLEGVHACGESEEEALNAAREAVELYVQSLLKHSAPIPVGVLESDETFAEVFPLRN